MVLSSIPGVTILEQQVDVNGTVLTRCKTFVPRQVVMRDQIVSFHLPSVMGVVLAVVLALVVPQEMVSCCANRLYYSFVCKGLIRLIRLSLWVSSMSSILYRAGVIAGVSLGTSSFFSWCSGIDGAVSGCSSGSSVSDTGGAVEHHNALLDRFTRFLVRRGCSVGETSLYCEFIDVSSFHVVEVVVLDLRPYFPSRLAVHPLRRRGRLRSCAFLREGDPIIGLHHDRTCWSACLACCRLPSEEVETVSASAIRSCLRSARRKRSQLLARATDVATAKAW